MISFWEKDIFKPKYDFLIIGAGFSGLWLAYFLNKKNPKAKISILEKGTFPTGASTKNAGFACIGSPSELLENVKNLGWDDTLQMTQKRFEGISLIKENFGNSIDFNPCGASEMFKTDEEFEEINADLDILNSHLLEIVGSKKHFTIDSEIIKDAGFSGFSKAISNSAEAAIHSGKLYHSLFKYLVAQNVNLFFGCEVNAVDIQNAIVSTNIGEFEANHLSICTNAFTSQIYSGHKINPGRGQVLITEPILNLKWNRTFHFDKGYFYFRNVGNRILIGGGRNLDFETETTAEFGLTEIIQHELEQMLTHNILPNHHFKIAERWAGIMAFTESKKPFSEIISQKCLLNAGMNGMGVALAPSLGQSLASSIS